MVTADAATAKALAAFKLRFAEATLETFVDELIAAEDLLLARVGEERYKSYHAMVAHVQFAYAKAKVAEQDGNSEEASTQMGIAERMLDGLKKRIDGLVVPTDGSVRSKAAFDLFLSYAHQNEADAVKLTKVFEKQKITTYVACKAIDGGDDFAEHVRRALLSSRELCLLVTPESLRSEWVLTEWGAAWAIGKRVTPILLGCVSDQLPRRLQQLQCVPFHQVRDFAAQCRKRWAVEQSGA